MWGRALQRLFSETAWSVEGFEYRGDKVSYLPGVDESSLRMKPALCLGSGCRDPAEGHGTC